MYVGTALTIPGTIGEQDEAELGVHYNVALTFLRLTYTTPVCECQLTMPRQAAEDSDDMFCGLVSFIYDDHPSGGTFASTI